MSRLSIDALLKKEFYQKIQGLEEDEKIKNTEAPEPFLNYNGADLQILEDKENWHEW